MRARQEVTSKVVIDGRPYTVSVIHNPTIEDVVVSEAKLTAADIIENNTANRRVGRDIRDFLIRLGVDR